MTEWLFERVSAEQIRLLNHFLKQQGEQSANRGDLNFWLKQHGKIIAVARLIPLIDTATKGFWLRGLFVVETHRKQGIGQQIMQQIHESIKSQQACWFSVYAFPHGHLGPFYRPLGYQFCESEDLPEPLRVRYEQAKKANKDWLCMVYSSTE